MLYAMIMAYSSLRIGSLFGIPIRLHITFLLTLPIFVWLFGTAYFEGSSLMWLWGFLLTVGLFAGVTLHELAHSYVASKKGIRIESIVLLPIGGVSQMRDVPEDPDVEMRMSAAGPLTSIALGMIFFLLSLPLYGGGTELYRFLVIMGFTNLFLGLFNLLPAFPMDGGRILRTRLAKKRRYDVATRLAVSIGHAIAVVLFLAGLLLGINGFMLMLVAMFIYIGGTEEERETSVYFAVRNLRVKDAMNTEVDCLKEDMRISDAIEEFLKTKHLMYPVLSREGYYLGILTLNEMSSVSKDERDALIVKDIMKSVDPLNPDDSARDAIQKMSGLNRLPVVERGRVVGVITVGDIMRVAQILNT
jgi:Zn-dependent protease/CBS domain-containing protein